MNPNPCDILAIDAATQSGVAIYRNGVFSRCAEVHVGSPDVHTWVTRALEGALARGRVLVVVRESTAPAYKSNSFYGERSVGSAWKRWKSALEWAWRERPERQPAPKFVKVNVSTWRSKIYGLRVSRDLSKKMAVLEANARLGASLLDKEHNAAEASLIGLWAVYAPEVLAVIPGRFQ